MTYICAKYLPGTQAVTVVNDSIARLYEQEFGCTTATVRNARPFEQLSPSPGSPDTVRLVHSGAAVPGRNLEGMIQAVNLLGAGYSLDFYLVPARDGGKYLRSLEALASGPNKVTFHPPVSPAALPGILNAYDIGIFSLPPRTRNHALMLPNKFFDFVQARLAIVFSPSVETTRLIEQFDLGAVTDDFSAESLAKTLQQLDRSRIAACKENAHKAALELSSKIDEDAEREILMRLLPQA